MDAFAGLRLIETGSLAPARLVGAFFGGLGAEVIRIVPPRGGDAGAAAGVGVRQLALDLFEPRGIGLLGRLLRRADLLVDGHSPGTLTGLGLDPARLAADHPGLLCLRMAAFEAPAAAWEATASDRAAVEATTADAASPTDAVTGPVAATATSALLAALVALARRHRTGLGGEVDRPIRIPVDTRADRPEPVLSPARALLGLSDRELAELRRDGVL